MRLLVVTQRVDEDDDVLGFFHNWLEEISRHVEGIDVLALYAGSIRLPAHVRVHSLGKERGLPRWRWVARFYERLLRLLPEADAVFCHMCPEYVLGLGPVNAFFRRPTLFWYAHVRVSPIARLAVRTVDRVLTPSRESLAIRTGNVVETGHGIDTDRFSPGPESPRRSPLRVLSLSRLSRVKDIATLIEAVHVLVNRRGFRDVRVRIVGGPARSEDAEYVESLHRRARDWGIEAYFDWVGPVPNKDAPSFYRDADVFVRMQAGGGYGKNELEALACGLPVVICAPHYEHVFGRFAPSLLFREGDAQGLADRILSVASWSEEDRRVFRNMARDYVVENHNLKRLARRIAEEAAKARREKRGIRR